MIAISGSARLPIDVHGIVTASATDGMSAADVVLFHAGVSDRRAWGPVIEVLSPRHRCVTFDARGFGESTYEPEPFSRADDAIAVMDAAGVARGVLIGCSIGGRTALDIVLDHPERVSGLVLVGSAIGGAPVEEPDPPEVSALAERLEAAEEAGDLEGVNRLEAQIWLDGVGGPEGRVPGATRELFLIMNRQALSAPPTGEEDQTSRAWHRLEEISVPTLVLVGELDLVEFQVRSEEAAQRIRGATFVRLPGVAHLPTLEGDPGCLGAIARFVGTIAGAP